MIQTEYRLVSVGVSVGPAYFLQKHAKARFKHAWAVWKAPQKKERKKERKSEALSETSGLCSSEHGLWGIGFGGSPIGYAGFMSCFKVQGNFLLLCSSNNFVGYSYIYNIQNSLQIYAFAVITKRWGCLRRSVRKCASGGLINLEYQGSSKGCMWYVFFQLTSLYLILFGSRFAGLALAIKKQSHRIHQLQHVLESSGIQHRIDKHCPKKTLSHIRQVRETFHRLAFLALASLLSMSHAPLWHLFAASSWSRLTLAALHGDEWKNS